MTRLVDLSLSLLVAVLWGVGVIALLNWI